MLNLSYETKKITLDVNALLDTSPIIAASNGFGGFDVVVGYRFCK